MNVTTSCGCVIFGDPPDIAYCPKHAIAFETYEALWNVVFLKTEEAFNKALEALAKIKE